MDNLVTIIIFCVLGVLIVTVFTFIVKSLVAPKKIDSIKKFIKQGKFSQAEKTAKAILAKNPHDFVTHFWLGETYMGANKTELAFMEYKLVNQSAIFDGQIPELAFRKKIAKLYQKYNQNAEALNEYLLISKMEPNNPDVTFNLGKIYENAGKTEVAIGFYQKTIKLNPRHAQAHAALGYLLFRSKQYLEAKKEIDFAIKQSPDTYSNYYYLGKILKENKDYSAALSAFEKAERDVNFRMKSLIERGSCYMMAQQIDNAALEFEHAVKCAKDEANQETLFARYFLAACYEKSRQIDKAIEQWEKIYTVNHTFKDVGAKLTEYKDLQSNDSMKEYLTSSSDRFMEICKKVSLAGFKLNASKCDSTRYGCTMLCSDQKSDNWMSVRQQLYLVEFYRETEPIEDSVIRRIADKVKLQNYAKAIVCASGGFTRSAIAFAENRPVELVDKDRLEKLLAQAGI